MAKLNMNFAIYSTNRVESLKIINFIKSFGIDTRSNTGGIKFKGYYYYVVDGVFGGATKKLLNLTNLPVLDVNKLNIIDTISIINKPKVVETPNVNVYPCEMMVCDDRRETRIKKNVIADVFDPIYKCKYYVISQLDGLWFYRYAEPIPPKVEVTKEAIAKMMNCNISQLVIKD